MRESRKGRVAGVRTVARDRDLSLAVGAGPLGMVAWCGLVALVIIWMLLRPRDAIEIMPGLFVFSAGARFAATCLHPDRGALTLLVDFFFLFFVAVPAYVQVHLGEFPFGGTYSDAELVTALGILVAGQLAYMTGSAVAGLRPPPRLPSSPTPLPALVRAAWIAGAVSLVCVAYIGVGTLLLPRFELEALIAEGSGWSGQLTNIGRGVSLFGLLVCVTVFRLERQAVRGPMLLCVLLNVGTFALLNNPMSLPRFQFLGFVLAIGAVLVSTFRRDLKVVFGLASPLFLFFIFPAIKVIGSGEGFNISAAFRRNVSTYLLSEDFDSFKQAMDTLRFLERYDPRGGENFLGAVLFWVPRSLWEDKPVHSGELVSKALGYPFNNVANSLPTEGYISWGMLGTLGVMAVFGALVGLVERRARVASTGRADASTVILYGVCVGVVIIVLRGALNAIAAMVGPGLLAYAVLLWWPARFARKKAS